MGSTLPTRSPLVDWPIGRSLRYGIVHIVGTRFIGCRTVLGPDPGLQPGSIPAGSPASGQLVCAAALHGRIREDARTAARSIAAATTKSPAARCRTSAACCADGLCSCCCTCNGICCCQCNLTMGICKCEYTKDGCCISCTSGDKACCAMIQACCNCLSTAAKGCCCYICFNNTPVCCGTCA